MRLDRHGLGGAPVKPYEVIAATRGSVLTPTQRLVLIHVSFRAGADGECWASVATLASDTGFKDRAIRAALSELVTMGVLASVSELGRTTRYRVVAAPAPRQDVPTTPAADAGVAIWTPARGAYPPAPRAGVPRHEVPTTPAADADNSILEPSHDSIPDSSQEPTGGGAALEDAPTVEDTTACTMVVRGRVAPDPDAPTELQVAELVALQQTAMPSRSDHDAVVRLLVKPGVTAEVARAMWEAAASDDWWQEATDTGEPRLRWRSLAKPGPGLDKRIGAAQEAVAELARRAWRNRAPDPPPPPKKFDIFAKKRFETVEQHEQRVRNLRAMMAGKTADGASK